MLNYRVDPSILEPFLPAHTELDTFRDNTFVSMVGFLFDNTRVLGIPIPFHQSFEEINLRFYVRHKGHDGWRRGVVFLKEIVPRAAIAFVARNIYGEPYVSMPTRHEWRFSDGDEEKPTEIRYLWRPAREWNSLSVVPVGSPQPLQAGSEEEFIAEHYWGYTKHTETSSSEYQVVHPSWKVWSVTSSELSCDVEALYGAQFSEALSGKPSSEFLARGSDIVVCQGSRIYSDRSR